MGFTIYRAGDLTTNERLISFYKKELRNSHILDTAKKQRFYGTKWYRKNVRYDFPSSRRYVRVKAIASDQYRKLKKQYNTLSQLGKVL